MPEVAAADSAEFRDGLTPATEQTKLYLSVSPARMGIHDIGRGNPVLWNMEEI